MSDRTARFQALVHGLQQRWGPRALQRGRDASTAQGAVLPTAIAALDALLPHGGLPRGALSILQGRATSGKTTLALRLVAEAQRANELAHWLDLPMTFDPHAAQREGVKLSELVLIRPQGSVEALSILRDILQGEAAGIVVMSLAESNEEAMSLSHGLRRLRPALTRSQALLVLLAERQGVWSSEAALTLQLQGVQWHFERDELVGYQVAVTNERGQSASVEVRL